MADMTYEDLHRDLRNCVVMHENKPVFVIGIGHDCTVQFRDLLSQRVGEAPFSLKAFTNPVRRTGMVNVGNSVVYMTRIPVRRYHMGLHANNVKVESIIGIDYPQGSGATRAMASGLNVPEVGDAIINKYPKLKEACAQVVRFKGACAFDKQFAVTSRGYVVYKKEVVGVIDINKAKSIDDIKWHEGKQHLIILLDGNYEKTVRDFRPTTR